MWKYWIRLLHDFPSLSCELYVYREGLERIGWDDHYVNTYRDKAEAERFAEALLSAPRDTWVDVGHGYAMMLPGK